MFLGFCFEHAEILRYYDKDAETRVITDASPVVLGAVLAQKQQGEFGSLDMPVEVKQK